MEANATLRKPGTSSSAVLFLVLGVIAAFLLGGTGGYLVRGLSPTPSVTTTNTTSGSPAPANASEPYRYPRSK